MRVRNFVIGAILAVATLAIALVVASGVLISRFDAIEREQAHDKGVQALRALEADLNQLALSTRDYAEWDDAREYTITPNPAFIQANFSYDSLNGMHVDEVVFMPPTGEPLYAAQVDDSRQELLPGPSPHVLALLAEVRPRIDALRERRSYERLIATPRGLMAFAIVDISRSNRTDPSGTLLFFGRYLRTDELQRMRETSQLPVMLNVGTVQKGTRVDGSTITAYEQLVNWRGEALATLSVSSRRDIGMLGRNTTFPLMGVIALLALLSIGAFLLLLHRLRQQWNERLALDAKHRRMLAALDEGVLLVEPETGRVLECNDAMHRLLGYAHDEFTSLTLGQIVVGISDLSELLRSPAADGLHECLLRTRTGQLIDAEVTATEVSDEGRNLACVVARDVSRRRQAEQSAREGKERLAKLAELDGLTGLPNRLHLQSQLPALLEKLNKEQRSLALLYIDLDHFKHVNDSRGHRFGDEILKIFAARLRNGTSAEDMVLRTGGDEFIVAAVMRSGLSDARDLGQRLLNLAATPITHEDVTMTLTASIGISVYPDDGADCESLLKHADIALYRAKGRGRHCYQVFTAEMGSELQERVLLEQALRHALESDEIYVELQPVFDLRSGELVSFESLARWRHPEMGVISPGRFIPIAESSGLITTLGALIVRKVLDQLRGWQDAGIPLVPVAINVSPSQLERTDFTTYVHEAALEYDIDPQWLSFEVTESAWLQDSSKHIVAIDTLRHSGSRIYIDDFGTGFSNLNYLKSLPIDVIKIDRSFINHVDTDSNDAMIVRSIVAVARQLRLETVAEGIETESQARKLRELGCTYGQGYLFGRPAVAAKHHELLQTRRLPDHLLPQRSAAIQQAAMA